MSEEQVKEVKPSDVVDVTSSDVAYGNSSALDKSGSSLWSRTLQKIQLEPTPGTFAPGRWSNADLDPVPPEQRQWTTMNFVFYWANDAITPGSLRLGSSLYSLGLSWKLTLLAVALGHFLMSIALTLNGLVGARFNIPFTIQSRASFGFFFSFAMVIVRMVVAGFWYGINTYTGAECVDTILRAIWPSFANIPNHLPDSANITTEMMISYVIYFIVVLPFHWIHPRNLKLFFTIKSCLCLPAVLGMVIWACTADGSGGGVDNEIFHRGNTVSGSALGWAFMSGLNAMLGNYGTLAVNINDFTRYAKKSRQTYVQLFIIPIAFLLMAFWGLVIVGSAERLYGELQWDPLTIMNRWNGSSKSRAGAVFVGAALLIAQMGTNVGANCVSAANDLNAMFPKYINIRRGQYLIAVIGAWALTPWNILSSAEALVNFMDGYSIWLAPITGVLLADFYLVHRRFYAVHDLYDPHGKYRYNRWGTNWRAALAWTVGWAPLLPGLAEAINSTLNISKGSSEIYDLGYLYGIFSSFAVYSVLSLVFPPRGTMAGRNRGEDFTEA